MTHFPQQDNWKPGDFIHYAGAVIDQEELDAIVETIEKSHGRNWIVGEAGTKFEEALARTACVDHVVLTNSGSSALLLAILGLGLPKGSKIAIPATCFPTALNAIHYAGHVPVIVDSDINTFNLNLLSLEYAVKNHGVDALVIELIAGNVPDMQELRDFCMAHQILTVVDNCDGFGGTFKGMPVESWMEVAVTSFHAAHIISAGEGGAVFTDIKPIADRVRQYRDWGREAGTDEPSLRMSVEGYPKRYSYVVAGFNLKPLELQAAMGLVQLKKLKRFMSMRSWNYTMLHRSLVESHVEAIDVVEGAEPCWLAMPVYCPHGREHFAKYLLNYGVETRPIFAGDITRQPYLNHIPHVVGSDLSGASVIYRNGILLPVHPRNKDVVYDYIATAIRNYLCGT